MSAGLPACRGGDGGGDEDDEEEDEDDEDDEDEGFKKKGEFRAKIARAGARYGTRTRAPH